MCQESARGANQFLPGIDLEHKAFIYPLRDRGGSIAEAIVFFLYIRALHVIKVSLRVSEAIENLYKNNLRVQSPKQIINRGRFQ